jgi:hypothetical protein
MKRDLDLVRGILLWMEAQAEGRNVNTWDFNIPGWTKREIGYHAYLMHQAGLIIAADATFTEDDAPNWTPSMITWDGYEFLAAARDKGLWEKAKSNIIGPAAAVSFALLLEWLKEEGKKRLGIS